ncbi:fimbrial biogenesis chaperone [Edaphovirga cremea]|uniref:fimbrial biogenesis chaperone n=1 Tax=Edaphovirga cremea TaxID=2267246 RepID=UPI000DEF4761|nr:molecular chaperone [Edaphovirga cremea]
MKQGNPSLLFAILIFTVVLCSNAFAAINLDRTRVIFGSNDKSVSVTLENQSKSLPYLAQVWIEDAKGEKITRPLVALPPMQRIDSGQKSQVRILQLPDTAALPKDRESLFYFNVREVPPKSDLANVMQVAIQSRVKLFFRPTAIAPKQGDIWQEKIAITTQVGAVKITNPTPFYITLGYLSKDNGGNFPGFDSAMIAPFASETISTGGYSGERYSIGYMDDYGGLQVNEYQCRSSQCELIKTRKTR